MRTIKEAIRLGIDPNMQALENNLQDLASRAALLSAAKTKLHQARKSLKNAEKSLIWYKQLVSDSKAHIRKIRRRLKS